MKCYICRFDEILGPYTEEETQYAANDSDLIWMTGIEKDWLTKQEWLSRKNSILAKETAKIKKTTEWFYAKKGKRFGPFKKIDMIQSLLKLKSIDEIKIWNKDLENWTDIFEFKDIVFAVGHENRKNPRVPINETITMTIDDEQNGTQVYMCKAVSLSSAGIGLSHLTLDVTNVKKIDLSLNFLLPDLRLRCRLIITNKKEKTASLSFSHLQQEARTVVMEYINKKLEDSDTYQQAA